MGITRTTRRAWEEADAKVCAQCGTGLTIGKVFSFIPAVQDVTSRRYEPALLFCSKECSDAYDEGYGDE